MSKKLIDSQMIGKTIKSLREANNLTQVALAEKIGYSVRNLRRIEKDGTTKIDVVNTFACAFEVSALDILDGDVFFLSKNCFCFCRKIIYFIFRTQVKLWRRKLMQFYLRFFLCS